MKEMLLKKKAELEAQLQRQQQELMALQEQFTMSQGAYQYNKLLLDELEASEKAQEAKKD